MRTELKTGLLLFACTLLLRQLTTVPEGLLGFFLGLSICFEVIAVLPEKAYGRLKQVKGRLFRR